MLRARFAGPAIVGEPVTVRGIERDATHDAASHHCMIWCENTQGKTLIEGDVTIP